jgi:hypothetical protein
MGSLTKGELTMPRNVRAYWVDAKVEVWQAEVIGCDWCDCIWPSDGESVGAPCPCTSCGEHPDAVLTPCDPPRMAWWYWHYFPGCLPDSEPIGPFPTEAEAIADARGEGSDA